MISIIIPVYNEEKTVATLVKKIVDVPFAFATELIVVDDGSRDGTGAILDELGRQRPIVLVRHEVNRGKGAAIKSALTLARGEIVVVQDADLEYDPRDIPRLVAAVASGKADVVYGSRNLDRRNRGGYWPYLWGGRFLSALASILYGQRLTDINTGYKVFRAELLKSLNLESAGFEFCAEVTAKILRRGVNIKELPVSYAPRKFSEGKKIRARDGLVALRTLLRYRFQRA